MTVSSQAEWYYQKDESAFGGPNVFLAFTESEGNGFGLRCDKQSLQSLLMVQDRSLDSETTDLINGAGSKLLILIDDEKKLSLDAAFAPANSDGFARVTAAIDADFVERIGAAKSQIIAAVEVLGNIFYETTFNVKGSTAKTALLLSDCPQTKAQ